MRPWRSSRSDGSRRDFLVATHAVDVVAGLEGIRVLACLEILPREEVDLDDEPAPGAIARVVRRAQHDIELSPVLLVELDEVPYRMVGTGLALLWVMRVAGEPPGPAPGRIDPVRGSDAAPAPLVPDDGVRRARALQVPRLVPLERAGNQAAVAADREGSPCRRTADAQVARVVGVGRHPSPVPVRNARQLDAHLGQRDRFACGALGGPAGDRGARERHGERQPQPPAPTAPGGPHRPHYRMPICFRPSRGMGDRSKDAGCPALPT